MGVEVISPNYVLKINEAFIVPQKEETKGYKILRAAFYVIVGCMILGAILFGKDFCQDFSGTSIVLLFATSVTLLKLRAPRDYSPFPMELRFYNDRFVLYRAKRLCFFGKSRMEFAEMKYADVTKCSYKTQSKRVQIYGDGVTTWYYYDKQGNLPDKPTKVNEYTGGMVYFSTRFAEDIDLVAEIESHSPLKFVIEND